MFTVAVLLERARAESSRAIRSKKKAGIFVPAGKF